MLDLPEVFQIQIDGDPELVSFELQNKHYFHDRLFNIEIAALFAELAGLNRCEVQHIVHQKVEQPRGRALDIH